MRWSPNSICSADCARLSLLCCFVSSICLSDYWPMLLGLLCCFVSYFDFNVPVFVYVISSGYSWRDSNIYSFDFNVLCLSSVYTIENNWDLIFLSSLSLRSIFYSTVPVASIPILSTTLVAILSLRRYWITLFSSSSIVLA